MIELIRFELKKILPKKWGIIGVLILLAFLLMLTIAGYQTRHSFDGVSNEGRGKQAVEIEKKVAKEYQGYLTDKKVQDIIKKYEINQDMKGANAKYVYQNAIQSAVFARFVKEDGSWNGLKVSDIFGNEKIRIGDSYGWLQTSQNLVKVLFVLSFLLIVTVSRVFSMEYRGMDAIILTSRYGKTKLVMAKIMASLLVGIVLVNLVICFHYIIAFILYGSSGLEASVLFSPVEFTEGYIPFNLTIKTLLFYQLILANASIIGIVGITLLISAISKTSVLSLIIGIMIVYIPFFLPISELNPIHKIVVLLPVYQIQFVSLMSVTQYNSVLYYALFSIPVALIICLLGSKSSEIIFRKHRVN